MPSWADQLRSERAGLVAQTPAGAIIDATQHKRAGLIGATARISVSVFLVTLVPIFAVITTAQILLGVAAAIFPPTLAAIALGIVGPKDYTSRTGRMQAFNHAGNVFAAAIAGLAGYLIAVPLGVLVGQHPGNLRHRRSADHRPAGDRQPAGPRTGTRAGRG